MSREKRIPHTSTSEPPATPEIGRDTRGNLDVVEVCIADGGATVPSKHRINGLGKLCAAGLVNTTGVGPAELKPFSSGLLARQYDLDEAGLLLDSGGDAITYVLIRNFFQAPSMRQDGICRDVALVHKLLESKGFRVQESHDVLVPSWWQNGRDGCHCNRKDNSSLKSEIA